MPMYCIEVGSRRAKNLCRMGQSIIVHGNTILDALELAEEQDRKIGAVQRVFAVERIVIDWIAGNTTVVPKKCGESITL